MKRFVLTLCVLIFSTAAVFAGGRGESVDPETVLRAVKGLSIARLQVTGRPGTAFEAPMVLDGARLTLELVPFSVRAPGFKVEVRGRGGRVSYLDPGPVRTVAGQVREIPGSRIAGILLDRGFEGTVELPGETVLWVEPVAKRLAETGRDFYAVSPCGLEEGEKGCGLSRNAEHHKELRSIFAASTGEGCATLGGCVAEVLCDTDYGFYTANNSSASQVQSTVEGLMALAVPRFQSPFAITHKVSSIVVRSVEAQDPYSNPTITTAQGLLGALAEQWPQGSHTSDLVHLFTLHSYGGTAGLAYVAGVCNFSSMFSFATGGAVGCPQAGLLIHELGHSWGAHHTSGGIMSPFPGDCNAAWCCTALTEIPTERDTVDGICLDLANQPPVPRFSYNCNGLACTFDASASTDDHGIASYSWSFGDLGTASVVGPAHTYSASGQYHVTLTVVDGNSLSASISQDVLLIFADVPLNHWARSYIEAIYHQGVTKGCLTNPLRYCPASQLHRDELAPFLVRAKLGGNHQPPPVDCNAPRFSDVPCTQWAAAWIEELAALGISKGCGIAGSYCPGDLVDRSQAAIFLLRTLSGGDYVPPPANCNAPRFADVPCTHWAAAWIEEFARRGITNGCGVPGSYCPADVVDRATMAVFLAKAFNYPLP